MARIRTIKPEFWTSAQVLECSTNARLLFIGLWNFADDAGRHPDSAKQAKAEVFPADDFTLADVQSLLDELSDHGLIRRYAVDGVGYFIITGWKHQRIDKPQPSKYPDPIHEHSESVPRTFPPDRKGKDKKGEEGKGEEGKGEEKKVRADALAQPDYLDNDVWQDFLAFRKQTKFPLTPSAWKSIDRELRAGIVKLHDPNVMLAEAMSAGWRGFRLDWYENRVKPNRVEVSRPESREFPA